MLCDKCQIIEQQDHIISLKWERLEHETREDRSSWFYKVNVKFRNIADSLVSFPTQSFLRTCLMMQRSTLFLYIYWKNVGNDIFWWQVISTFEGRFSPSWRVKVLPQLVGLISPMLPSAPIQKLPFTWKSVCSWTNWSHW